MRQYSILDQIILGMDKFMHSLEGIKLTNKNQPQNTGDPISDISDISEADELKLSPQEQKHSAALMRINHSGEVCAQALYLGQAWVARDPALAEELYQAAAEEKAHLNWCENRIQELGDKKSFLNPLWATGSFGMGVLAGLMGDKISLGFLAETERQVSLHLEKHLQEISPKDLKSQAIIKQMKLEEEGHKNHAEALGGIPLPKFIQVGMAFTAKIMTFTARYI